MCWEIPILRQNSGGLTTHRSSENLLALISIDMIRAEIRTDPITFLPALHIVTYGKDFASHVRAWNNTWFSREGEG